MYYLYKPNKQTVTAVKTLKKIPQIYWRSAWKKIFPWFVVLTVIGFFLSQTSIADNKDLNLNWWEPWLLEYSAVYSYGLLCPIIIVNCRRWLLDSTQIYWSFFKILLLYLPFTFLFISLMLLVRNVAYLLIEDSSWYSGSLYERYIYEFPKSIPFYFAVVFGTYTKIYFETYQKERINAAQLNEKLLIAQIGILRNQLQPHFLFNTLNLISGTMYQDVDKADSIITRLGDLLRYSLTAEQTPWVTFAQEMQAMNSFLEIAKLRFDDRIQTKMDIQEGVNSILIPVMLLQPLLENAIKYGIEPSDQKGEIVIAARLLDDRLHIMISNPSLSQTSLQPSFGVGLKNTKERLQLLFGDLASISLNKEQNKRIVLSLTLPASFKDNKQQSRKACL
ncbi:MAG: sensor histidine kinase [Osedax symbiont Rs2]|nr:MAG: sensor histidine kinase [Osedax symbiont Rs2]